VFEWLFFFQAEDGIRDGHVTGVQTCALPISTNEACDSQVDYGLTTAYGNSTPLNLSLLTAHAVTLTGLLATTTYHYRVKSRDAAGNLATSADFTLTTLLGGTDSTPPTVSITAS